MFEITVRPKAAALLTDWFFVNCKQHRLQFHITAQINMKTTIYNGHLTLTSHSKQLVELLTTS